MILYSNDLNWSNDKRNKLEKCFENKSPCLLNSSSLTVFHPLTGSFCTFALSFGSLSLFTNYITHLWEDSDWWCYCIQPEDAKFWVWKVFPVSFQLFIYIWRSVRPCLLNTENKSQGWEAINTFQVGVSSLNSTFQTASYCSAHIFDFDHSGVDWCMLVIR